MSRTATRRYVFAWSPQVGWDRKAAQRPVVFSRLPQARSAAVATLSFAHPKGRAPEKLPLGASHGRDVRGELDLLPVDAEVPGLDLTASLEADAFSSVWVRTDPPARSPRARAPVSCP